MERKDIFKYSLMILAILLFYFSYQVLSSFLITLIMSVILTFVFYPLYKKILKYVKKDWLASSIMILIILLIIIIPSVLLITKLVSQSASAYRTILDFDFKLDNVPYVSQASPMFISHIQNIIDGSMSFVKDFIVNTAPDVIGEIANVLLLLFIAFFTMFYLFINGAEWYSVIKKRAPFNPKVKSLLFDDIERTTSGVIHGQFITALIQGSLGGLMLFIFGVPNYVFWGFIMIIFSFIPVLGTPLIFVPAAIIELIQHDYIAGIGILIVGFVVVVNVDNVIRPYLVGAKTKLHPIVVLIGVLGGLNAFGLVGMVLGPLVLGLTITLIRDYFTHPDILGIK